MSVTAASKSDGGERGNAPKSPDRPMGDRTFKAMLFSEQRKERNPVVFYRNSKNKYDPEASLDEKALDPTIVDVKKLLFDMKTSGIELGAHSLKERVRQQTVGNSMSNPPEPYYTPESAADRTLAFESRFESGNLNLAMKLSDSEYNLILQNDINTNGHTQWFFFRVGNTRQRQKVKFNMLNLAKSDSLYNYGMKVLCFSEKEKEKSGREWF